MTRYLENLNECTDPVSGDMLHIYDASAGSTDKDRRVDIKNFVMQGVVPATGKLHLKDGGYRLGMTLERSGTSVKRAYLYIGDGTNSTTTDDIYFDSIGADIHIRAGVAGATTILTVQTAGSIKVPALAGSGNRAVYSDADGALTNSSSDGTMKTDIAPIDDNEALVIIESLRPVRYRWNEDLRSRLGDQVELGLIAQDVKPMVPEVVGANSDGTLTLDYAKLVPVLIGAVQALSERVTALETLVK